MAALLLLLTLQQTMLEYEVKLEILAAAAAHQDLKAEERRVRCSIADPVSKTCKIITASS